jgi:hypothetical protein
MPAPTTEEFNRAFSLLTDYGLSWALKMSMLQNIIPQSYFHNELNHHCNLVRHLTELLSYATPGSALETHLLKTLELDGLGVTSTWRNVAGLTNWPCFWVSVYACSHAEGKIRKLAERCIRNIVDNTRALEWAARKLATSNPEAQNLIRTLDNKAVGAAQHWTDWIIVLRIAGKTDDNNLRRRACVQLTRSDVNKESLESLLNNSDLETRLIAARLLTALEPNHLHAWQTLFISTYFEDESTTAWKQCLALGNNPIDLATLLFHTWDHAQRRGQCSQALRQLKAPFDQWMLARGHIWTQHRNECSVEIQQLLLGKAVAEASTTHDWAWLCDSARHQQKPEFAKRAFDHALELANTFADLNAVYKLCLQDREHGGKRHNPAHTELIANLLGRMRTLGTFDDWKNGHHILNKDRLPELVRLATTIKQMSHLYVRYFRDGDIIMQHRTLYNEIIHRLQAAGPLLNAS